MKDPTQTARHNLIRATVRDAMINNDVPFRMVCPVCLGGSDHEECLSVWGANETTGVTCHRAACDVGTYFFSWGGATRRPVQVEEEHKLASPNVYGGRDLKRADLERWKYRDRLSIQSLYHMAQVYGNRLGIEMRDAVGKTKGIVMRALNDTTQPKSLTYKYDREYNGMSWFLPHSNLACPYVIAVEDCLSALCLMQEGFPAVSLNGTGLGRGRLEEMLQYKWQVILMLDADATRKAIQYSTQYGPDKVRVVRLTTDLKDMSKEDMIKFVREAVGERQVE